MFKSIRVQIQAQEMIFYFLLKPSVSLNLKKPVTFLSPEQAQGVLETKCQSVFFVIDLFFFNWANVVKPFFCLFPL